MTPAEEAALPYLTPRGDDEETQPPPKHWALQPAPWGSNLVFAGLILIMVTVQPSGWAIGWTLAAIYGGMWSVVCWLQAAKAWRDVRDEAPGLWRRIPRWRRVLGYLRIVVFAPFNMGPMLVANWWDKRRKS